MTQSPPSNHNSMQNEPNALIHASSPYLLQHAFNPVAWEEWSDPTWQRAKQIGFGEHRLQHLPLVSRDGTREF